MESKLVKNSLVLLAASLFANFFLFLFNVAMARALSAEEFGAMAFITSVTSFFVIFFELGTGTSTTYFLSKSIAAKKAGETGRILSSSARLSIVVSTVPAIILFAFADSIAGIFAANTGTAMMLRIASIAVFSTAISRYFSSVFNAFQKMALSGIASATMQLFRLAGALALALPGFGLFGVVAGWSIASLASACISAIMMIFFLKKQNLRLFSNAGEEKRILRYGVHSAPQFFGMYSVPIIANIIVAATGSAGDVANFALAFSTTSLVFIVLLPVSNSLLPIASGMGASQETKKKLPGLSEKALAYNFLFSAITATTMILFSGEIIALLYGSQYQGAAILLSMLGFAVMFDSQKIITDPLLTGTGNAKLASAIELAKIAIVVIGGLFMMAVSGTTGLALAVIAAYLFSATAKIFVCKKRLGVSLKKSMAIQFALAAFLAALLLLARVLNR